MLTIHLDSSVPLVDQIAQGIRQLIAIGELKPGDTLPTVRQLATDLGVNFNTVSRAYQILETDGLVRTLRRRGTEVIASGETIRGSKAENKSRIKRELEEALVNARLAGLDREAIEKLFQQLMNEYWEKSGE
jgi:GntR family transcriptional regulator